MEAATAEFNADPVGLRCSIDAELAEMGLDPDGKPVEPMEKAARPKPSTEDVEHPMGRMTGLEHGQHCEAHLQEFMGLRRQLHATDDPDEQRKIAARMQALSAHRGQHLVAHQQARETPPEPVTRDPQARGKATQRRPVNAKLRKKAE